MYQTVGSELIDSISQCLGVPVIKQSLSKQEYDEQNMQLNYEENTDLEVEDLFELLKRVK